ncbi:SGNH/GDSL hydrolase family protein [Patescibacteria group bacterium]|nr:SGNH/GDSL hydrolase family protein [Patescibacteria group bacterium]
MNKKIFLFSGLILLELTIICYLLTRIVTSRNGFSYGVINRKNLDMTASSGLKHFYEPVPNSIDKTNSWSLNQGINTINNDALNERFNYAVDKSKGTYRIITLGDSYTYGLYIDTKDNWTEKLEDMLNTELKCNNINKFEVINLAVYGYDFQYNLERYKKRGIKYQPDLIVWYITDPFRITDQIIDLANKITDELKKRNDIKKIDSYYPWNEAWRQIYNQYGPKEILNLQLSWLKKFHNLYQGPLVFMYSNERIRVSLQHVFDKFLTDYYNKSGSLGITLTKQDHFLTDNHPNQTGHQKIAETVFNYLIKDKLIPCH